MQLHDNSCMDLELLFFRPCKQPSFNGNKLTPEPQLKTLVCSCTMPSNMHFD